MLNTKEKAYAYYISYFEKKNSSAPQPVDIFPFTISACK